MTSPFLDTNVLLRHFLGDHATQSPRASHYLKAIEDRQISVCIADTVVFETVFTLERSYHIPKAKIREVLLPLILLPNVVFAGKRRFGKVFDLYVDLNISFADAYHVVVAQKLKTNRIVSFDRDFDKVQGVKRIEP